NIVDRSNVGPDLASVRAIRPSNHHRCSNAALSERRFGSTKRQVTFLKDAAVVTDEYDDRGILLPAVGESLQNAAHITVELMDERLVAAGRRGRIERCIFRCWCKRCMRREKPQIHEPRFSRR